MKIHNASRRKPSRLGQGLDALLGPSRKEERILFLDIENVRPDSTQPRRVFDPESLKELADSIKSQGLLQPILVRKRGEAYQIIAGERRWRAVCQAGLRQIPALVKNPDPTQNQLWTLMENIQREDLSPIEEARAFKEIMEQRNLTQEELSKQLGRSRSSVANTLRLLNLDPEVQRLLETKKIGFAQARELLSFASPAKQRAMAKKCLKKKWTVRALHSSPASSSLNPPFWLKKALSSIEKHLSCRKIRFSYSKKSKGRLVFSFHSERELKELLNQFLGKKEL